MQWLTVSVAMCVIVAVAVPMANASPVVVGDGIPGSLTGVAGDAAKGRTIVATRQVGLCLLCHTGPIAEEKFQGTLAPDLSGAGARLTTAQLRLRMVDSRKINPSSIMPAYFRSEGLFSRRHAVAGEDDTVGAAGGGCRGVSGDVEVIAEPIGCRRGPNFVVRIDP